MFWHAIEGLLSAVALPAESRSVLELVVILDGPDGGMDGAAPEQALLVDRD